MQHAAPSTPIRLATPTTAAGAIALVRIAYLILLCPYELAADEAQYWDWSRRLDLSYYSKGPGIAWLIAASTRLFGNSEWAVRLPAVISLWIMTEAVMRLASAAAPRANERAAATAALLAVCCVPAFHATALLMTIDAPFLACWALSAAIAWRLITPPVQGAPSRLAPWIGFALTLGVGTLFKYTILLLLPGLLLALVIERARRPRIAPIHLALAAAVCAVVVSPIVIWNSRQGWPTLAHLLGHLGAPGGDTAPAGKPWAYEPRWTLEFLGTQAGIIGPLLLVMTLALRAAWIRRAEFDADWRAARFALCLAAPILLFYLGLSFLTDVEGNWPIAGYLTLLVPIAIAVARGAATTGGFFRAAWHWSIGYGVAAAVGLMTLNLLDRVPILTDAVPYHRLSGHRAFASDVHAAVRDGSPVFIADQYTRAALFAYYLPGRPAVCSATSFLGGRKSSYDFFDDTSLTRPGLLGLDAILIGSTAERWSEAFRFTRVELLIERSGRRSPVYLGVNYQGPAPRTAIVARP